MPLSCPPEAELLHLALADPASADAAIARHAEGCASCRSTIAEIREIGDGLRSSSASTLAGEGACLDEAAMAAVAAGGDDVSRPEHLAHLAGCVECRRQLASLLRLLADPGVAAEVRRLDDRRVPDHRARGPRRRFIVGAGALAAAAVVLLVTRPRTPEESVAAHRGPTITAAAAPTLVAPVGDIGLAPDDRVLRWTGVAGATRYRVTLFDATGTVLFESQLTDTTTALPDSVHLDPERSYLWKVEVRTSWERWTSSELIEFRIREGQRPDAILDPASPLVSFAAFATPVALPGSDSLRFLAPRLSDSALVLEARARPLELRDALSETLARSVRATAPARDQELVTARRLAAAYAVAWRDVFLVREVARFTLWPLERRAAKVWADSVRRAGIAAYGRDGAAAAVAIWRKALGRLEVIADTAGMAATLGNIGAGLAHDGSADSAERYLERARVLAASVGDYRVEANATSELAGVSETRDDFAGARERYLRAITLRERIGDSRGLASDYNNLGGLAQASGDLDEARRQLEAALALNRRDGRDEVAATNLVNLASLASLRGDFSRADAMYREALATWRDAEQWADVADAERGLGDLEIRRGDYPAARAHLLEALAIYDRTGPMAEALDVRRVLAATRAAAGNLQGALDELRRAQHLADSARMPANVRAAIALARADLAAQLNARPQADRLYANAQALYRQAGDRAGEAEAQHGRGMLLLEQDDTAGSERLLGAALRTQLATGNQRGASLTRLALGALSLRRGDTADARGQLALAASELAGLRDPVAVGAALGERAALESAAGLPAAAESLYRAGIAAVGDRVAPDVTWRLHAGLGAVRLALGATDDAARELRSAIADVERSGRSLALAERRSGFLIDKWDVYVQLALLERSRGRVSAAFDVSERLRASEMLGLLARGRVSTPRDTAASLASREQDLRRRIAELTHALEGDGGRDVQRGPNVARAGPVTREALLRAQESYGDLLLEMRERAPRHAALVTRETSTWRDVARHVAPDEAFVEYLLSDATSIAFVVTSDTVTVVELPAGRRDLARLVDFVRGTLQPRGSPRVDSLWRAPLRQLHRDLVAPIEAAGLLRGRTRLVLVPHAELHYLPFAALLDGDGAGRFLVERYQVAVTPSASVWLALAARAPARATAGIIAFAPRPDALPASRQEVAGIARLGGHDARILVGSEATESTFRREAPSRRVIHLATYGVLNKQNPLFSFVEFAPGRADDGRLEAHEVFGLRLAADLVVLSACQTGLASGAITDVPAGDDWVGLARAFLSAGAARVMATLWPVQDRATAALMEQFYERYTAGADPGRALADAQRSMLAIPATASPYYWAGFELVGGR